MSRAQTGRLGPELAEFVGTGLLLAAVVGSGMALGGAGVGPGIALMVSAASVGSLLAAMIIALGPVSRAHFNPAVTMATLLQGLIDRATAMRYLVAQIAGGIAGVAVADLMFEGDVFSLSDVERAGWGTTIGEAVAAFGLVLLILRSARSGRFLEIGLTVGAFIAAAVLFTSSGAFANPAVTLTRMLTPSPAGIDPASVPAFLGAQLVGALLAVAADRAMAAEGHADDGTQAA